MDWLKETENGEIFDTSGPLRVAPRGGEFYVLGLGMVELVPSIHEGNQLIRDLRDGNVTQGETQNDRIDCVDTHHVGAVDRTRKLSRV